MITSSQVTIGKTNSVLRLSVLSWDGLPRPVIWQSFRDKKHKFHKWVTGPSPSFSVSWSLGTTLHEAIGVSGQRSGASTDRIYARLLDWLEPDFESIAFKAFKALHDGLLLCVPLL